jgi:hypothetical protein
MHYLQITLFQLIGIICLWKLLCFVCTYIYEFFYSILFYQKKRMGAATRTINDLEPTICTHIPSTMQVCTKALYVDQHKREIVSKTYGGVRHFMFVDLITWFKNSFSSWITVLTATWWTNGNSSSKELKQGATRNWFTQYNLSTENNL